MKYASAPAFRDALEHRLRAQSHEDGVSLLRLRKRVAFERFLARLVVAAPERWLLKGAFALELRFGLQSRMTKDVDLARSDDEQAATEDLVAATAVELGDFFVYDVRRTPALDAAAGFRAVRFTVVCELAGRRFEQFPVDVALAEKRKLEPDWLRAPDLLAFADIQPPELPVVGLEQHIAEKLHAYTGRYGTAGHPSTRSKDLIDIVLVAGFAQLDAAALREKLDTTFGSRARQPLPDAIPEPPSAWAESYATLAAEVGLDPALTAGHADASALLDPALSGTARGSWHPERRHWSEPGR